MISDKCKIQSAIMLVVVIATLALHQKVIAKILVENKKQKIKKPEIVNPPMANP